MSIKSFNLPQQVCKQSSQGSKSTGLNFFEEISQKIVQYPTNDSVVESIQAKEYNKLEEILQARQAAIRSHIQQKNHLRINLENLKDKNELLAKTHLEMLHFYQEKVTALKMQNQTLRKYTKKSQSPQFKLKSYLNMPISVIQADFNNQKPILRKLTNNNLLHQQCQKVEIPHGNSPSKNVLTNSRKTSPKHQIKHKRSQRLTPVDMINIKTNNAKVNLLRQSNMHNAKTLDSKESFRQEIKLIIEKGKNQSLTRVSEYNKLRQFQSQRESQQYLLKVKTNCNKISKKDKDLDSKYKVLGKYEKKMFTNVEILIKKCSSVNL